MGLYSTIAGYYDLIFPFDNTIFQFLDKNLPAKKRDTIIHSQGKSGDTGSEMLPAEILDVACGTGTYPVRLSRTGRKVTGLDLDEKMVQAAADKSENSLTSFKKADMLNPGLSKNFDGVYCIGNSLVHLPGIDEISLFAGIYSGIILKGGVLIIQIINFDRIISRNIRTLPPLETEQILFRREYLPENDNHVIFKTELTLKSENRVLSDTVTLLTLKKDDLAGIIEKAGFKIVNIYGSYSGEPWSDSSFLTLLKAVRT